MDNIVVIDGELSLTSCIDGDMDLLSTLDGEIDKVIYIHTGVVYDGDYVVTPLVNSQVILDTSGKLMRDDVTVLKVPFYETSNPAGGNTAYIGENV